MTKAELIQELRAKVKKAHPYVKRVFLRGLEYKTKPELKRLLKKVRVVRGGDISLS